jgi:type VI secretion system protein ImpI/type VI secretion system protein
MGLTLITIRCPAGVAPDRRELASGDLTMGRGTECDWVLADPGRILSKRHCQVTARGGTWLVTDESANGTFLNDSALDSGLPHPLRDRDRLALGQYELEVRIDAAACDDPSDAPTRFAPPLGLLSEERLTSDPFAPETGDPLAFARPAVGLPLDFDALLSNEDQIEESASPSADHTPDLDAHFRPPRPSLSILPEDWDLDVESPVGPEAPSPLSAAEPEAMPEPPPAATEPGPRHPDAANFAAFLAGARIGGELPPDLDATLRQLGETFRAVVSGLRQSMIARAAVKSEFRIGQTMIRPAGNNPLKFSADDDDALAALIGIGRQSSMRPADAVTDALRDIRLHELATAVALQSAARNLLAEISPERVMRGVPGRARVGLIGRRKHAAWDAYVARHAAVAQALSDDFDSVFGSAFARAYESALDAIAAEQEGHADESGSLLDRAPRSERAP